jgi:hypothetical protein
MQIEENHYGKFVIYHGMYRSCQLSKKSGDFLLRSLYSVIGKQKASEFFLRGLEDHILELTEEVALDRYELSKSFLKDLHTSSEWVKEQEHMAFFSTMKKLQDKHTKLNHIDKYKALELNSSIIFKHLKSVD